MSDLALRAPPAFRLEQLAVVLFLFAALLAFSIFYALTQADPTFFRTHALAWSSAILVTPALYIFVRQYGRGRLGHWWRLFWTAAWAMIAIHFVWGLGFEHFWKPLTVFERQGFFVAFPIFLLEAVWVVDILLSWIRMDWARAGGVYKYWQAFVWLLVFLNFFIALVIFRNDTPSLIIGLIQAAAIALAFVMRWVEREQSR
jgi:hypothetical protein